jgi:protein involved in sex pheromone biosynthesis
MRKTKVLTVCGVALLLAGCMGHTLQDEENDVVKTEASVIDSQETDELPDPSVAARIEARKFIAKEWQDTLQLQRQVLEAKAAQSRYVLAGRTRDAAVFDSVFISTLRTVDPDLAFQLQR